MGVTDTHIRLIAFNYGRRKSTKHSDVRWRTVLPITAGGRPQATCSCGMYSE